MIRHVIVEGVDGAGKTTLIRRLVPTLNLVRHGRASSSLGGPVANLSDWHLNDMRTIHTQPASIYDRHPLISEPIYAPIARHTVPQGFYADPEWVAAQKLRLSQHALVVWCFPPWNTVRRNVLAGEEHMKGVAANIRPLYEAYRKASSSWPGVSLWYDYTSRTPEAAMVALIAGIHRHFKEVSNVA